MLHASLLQSSISLIQRLVLPLASRVSSSSFPAAASASLPAASASAPFAPDADGGACWGQSGLRSIPGAGFGFGAVRWKTKKAGGNATQKKKPIPKNLGVKMYGGELIVPGQIIVRQRGSKYWPGYNVGIGRDFNIFATTAGFVKFSTEEMKSKGGDLVHTRRRVSVVPINGDWSPAYERDVVPALVARRAVIKREMHRAKALEPALFFSPTPKPNPTLAYADVFKPVAFTKQMVSGPVQAALQQRRGEKEQERQIVQQ